MPLHRSILAPLIVLGLTAGEARAATPVVAKDNTASIGPFKFGFADCWLRGAAWPAPPTTSTAMYLGPFGEYRVPFSAQTGLLYLDVLFASALFFSIGAYLLLTRRRRVKQVADPSGLRAEAFTIKRMLVVVMLVAVGTGLATFRFSYEGLILLQSHPVMGRMLCYVAGAIIVAAVLGMAKRPIVGAAIGVLIQHLFILGINHHVGVRGF